MTLLPLLVLFGTGAIAVSTSPNDPQRCPIPYVPGPVANPDVVVNPQCPQDDDTLFVTPGGTYFYFKCCAHAPGNDIGFSKPGLTVAECAQFCADTPGCQGAGWAISANGSPDGCVLRDGNDVAAASECGTNLDDALIIADPPVQGQDDDPMVLCWTECPGASGQTYTTTTNQRMMMTCGSRHGTPPIDQSTEPNLKACMEKCGLRVGCASVDYSLRSKVCYLTDHSGVPTVPASGFASAYSLGCKGSCGQSDDSCKCC